MIKNLNLSTAEPNGIRVSDAHFGLNFVSDYEKIGTQGWEQFDNIVNRIDINSLRYPGGSTAETLFDYRNPNKEIAINGAGETVKMESLDEYLSYCNREGINPTIIVPTRCLLTTSTVDGHRSFDSAQSADLQYFFANVLAKVDPNLQVSFELGNEYETYMTSIEYGRVANSLVQLIGEAYSNLEGVGTGSNTRLEPEIFVQAWGYSVGGGTTYDELMTRNQQVINQFSADSLSKIDGVVSHYYFQEGRNQGTDQAQTLLGIDDQIFKIAQMHRMWELACNKEMISRISEWNILFRSTSDLGLQQINPMMEMFTSFIREGFDALDFWSAQYHATSLADSSGRPMAAGVLMDVLKPAVVGTDVASTVKDDGLVAYTFIGSGRFVAVISSTTVEEIELGISTSLFPPGYRLVDAYSIGVDETTSDGKYRTLVNLPSYGEPDARVLLTQLSISLINGSTPVHNLSSFETLVLVFTLDIPGRPFVYGSDSADLFYGTNTPTVYVGGANTDSISYATATEGIKIDLSLSATDPSNTGDVLISVEVVRGSSWNDTIIGSGDGNLIDGRIGDDFLAGGDGADSLYGGSNDDSLFGGNGNDILDGGADDDFLSPGGGNDSVYGGTGVDVLSFDDYDDGVTVWVDAGVVNSERGVITFRGVENFVGSKFNDRFSLGFADSTVNGLDGDDIFEVLVGGQHSIDAGDGNDSVIIYRGSVSVQAGAGNDKITSFNSSLYVNGGEGDDWILSSGSRNVFEGGDGDDVIHALGRFDRFIFGDDSGRDVIFGFNPDEDILSYTGDGMIAPWLIRTDEGSQVFFDATNCVLLSNCFVDSLDDLQFLFA